MSDARRRELRDTYDQRPRAAGVYALRNSVTGRTFIASSADLTSVRNRFDFAQATNSVGALDTRVAADARTFGVASFEFEILDQLTVEPNVSADQLADDLTELEALWRSKLADTDLY